MWFRSSLEFSVSATQHSRSRRVHGAADCRLDARRLFLERLEDRTLMAFNVLAEYATGSSPVDLALTQMDAGSQPDLVVANDSDRTVAVRPGNADGTFGTSQTSDVGDFHRALVTGEFTSDGIPDVAAASNTGVSLLAGNGNGTFAAPQSISLPDVMPPGSTELRPQFPLSMATGDLNADGKLDLVVGTDTYFTQKSCYTGYYGGYYCNYFNSYDGYVNVLIGNGAGGFGPAETHHLGSYVFPYAVAAGDITSDNHADVITANNGNLSVLLGDGTGAVGSPTNSGSGYSLGSISLGDVDGDGKVDTLLGSGGYGLVVQKGNGLGAFTAQPQVSTGAYVTSAVMGDVNADGKLDLVAAGASNVFTCTSYGYYGCYDGFNTTTRQATVILGNGLGNFTLPLTSSLGTELGYGWLPHVALADLTGDGLPELATVDRYFNKAIIATNDGDWNPPPSIAISDAVAVVEGDNGTLNTVFTVTIVGVHGGVTVDFSTANYSAAAGVDYTSTSGTLTFTASESSKTISVPVMGDTMDEYDEQFFVNLSNAVGGVITDSQGVGTILDDDAAPLVTINDISGSEGNRGTTSFSITVGLSSASGKWVYVDFATADGTATIADNDYFANSGYVYFAPGQTTATITVRVRGDKKKEANETFFVNLTDAADGTISDSQGVGTIINNDGGKGKGNGGAGASSIDALLADDTLTTTRKRK